MTLAELTRCAVCRRFIADVDDWRFVRRPDGTLGSVCWRCIEKGDEGPDTGLSYEEDEDDDRDG